MTDKTRLNWLLSPWMAILLVAACFSLAYYVDWRANQSRKAVPVESRNR